MLKLTKVSSFYGKVEALKGISLEVNRREVVAMIGANGAGKTTTMRTISGLMKSTGSIEFLGKRIERWAPKDIVALGVSHVPEGGGVFPDMSVIENLELGACIRKDNSEVNKDMERVFGLFPRLGERAGQLAGTLSGGERQMLAVGRGLLARPKILILDEPTLGLSPLMVQHLADIIKKLNEDGQTILLVEQNARMAMSLANRVYVLETGRISIEGPAEELCQNEHVKEAYLGK